MMDESGVRTERCEVLDAGDYPLGTRISIEGNENGTVPEQIDIDTFFSIPMEVRGNTVFCGGKALLIQGKPIHTKIVSQGNVH